MGATERTPRQMKRRQAQRLLEAAGFTNEGQSKHLKYRDPTGQETVVLGTSKMLDPGGAEDVMRAVRRARARARCAEKGVTAQQQCDYAAAVAERPGEKASTYADMVGGARPGATKQLNTLRKREVVARLDMDGFYLWYLWDDPVIRTETIVRAASVEEEESYYEDEEPGGFADRVDAALEMESYADEAAETTEPEGDDDDLVGKLEASVKATLPTPLDRRLFEATKLRQAAEDGVVAAEELLAQEKDKLTKADTLINKLELMLKLEEEINDLGL